MPEYITSFMFKCEFVGEDALEPNELRIYNSLYDLHWVKAFVMEVSVDFVMGV